MEIRGLHPTFPGMKELNGIVADLKMHLRKGKKSELMFSLDGNIHIGVLIF